VAALETRLNPAGHPRIRFVLAGVPAPPACAIWFWTDGVADAGHDARHVTAVRGMQARTSAAAPAALAAGQTSLHPTVRFFCVCAKVGTFATVHAGCERLTADAGRQARCCSSPVEPRKAGA
jgi:hypothetical protein